MNSPPRSLRQGTLVYAAAVLLDRLLGLLLLPLLTRAIVPSDYGAWTQTAVVAGLMMPLVLLGTPTAIVRSFSGAVAAAARRRAFVRLGALALLPMLVCAALVLAWREPFARLVYGEAGRETLVPALLALLAADAAVDFAGAWLRAGGRIGLVAAVLALRSVLRYAVLMGLMGLVGGLAGAGGGALADWLGRYAAVQVALALLLLAATWRVLRMGSDPVVPPVEAAAMPRLRPLLAFGLPLVALSLFTAFNASFDRFLLVRLLGLDTVAVYAAAASLCGVPALVYTVLGFTLFPVLARHWNDGRRDLAARLTTQALQVHAFLCLPLALALALVGPALLPLLSTADYQAPPAVFVLLGLSVAAFGLYQIVLYALLLDGRSRQVLALAVAAAALNALLNLLLVPRWGMAGAAAAAAAANAAMVLCATRLARSAMPWRFPSARLAAIGWRTLVAALPLAWASSPWGAPASWTLLAGALLLGGLLHLALDWRRSESVARMLLPR